MLEGETDLVGEAEALGDGRGLRGVPWGRCVRLFDVLRKGGGDDMNAVAAGGGVEDEAGGGMGVVGDLGALVGGEGDGGVGVAGGDHREAAGGEESAEAASEGQGHVFFKDIVGEMSAGVGASVTGIEEDDGAGLRLLGQGDSARQKNDGEASREVFEGKGQGRLVDRLVDCNGLELSAIHALHQAALWVFPRTIADQMAEIRQQSRYELSADVREREQERTRGAKVGALAMPHQFSRCRHAHKRSLEFVGFPVREFDPVYATLE
jgi:hypothetical protein